MNASLLKWNNGAFPKPGKYGRSDQNQRRQMLLICYGLFEVALSFFAVRGISNREGRQGWAPQTRLENFMWTDTLEEGGAHCWKGSFDNYSTSSPHPPPNAHTVFLYSLHSLSCNSRNICAQVCWHVHGPWVHREGEEYMVHCKNSINSSPFLFLVFLLLSPLLCCSVPLILNSIVPHFSHLHAIWEPAVTKLTDVGSVFSKFSLPWCRFLSDSLLHLCFFKMHKWQIKVTQEAKEVLALTVRLLIDSCAFAFGSCRSKFHPAPFFSSITHFSFTFSQLPFFSFHHIFSSVHLSPPCSAFQMRPAFHSYLLYDSSHLFLSWPCSYVPSFFINLSKWKISSCWFMTPTAFNSWRVRKSYITVWYIWQRCIF